MKIHPKIVLGVKICAAALLLVELLWWVVVIPEIVKDFHAALPSIVDRVQAALIFSLPFWPSHWLQKWCVLVPATLVFLYGSIQCMSDIVQRMLLGYACVLNPIVMAWFAVFLVFFLGQSYLMALTALARMKPGRPDGIVGV